MTAPSKIRIDIISDVMCPWCVIGYLGLKQALEELKGEIKAELHWQPFELNPNMPAEGQELGLHIMEKYGSSQEQSQANRDHIISLGTNLGFEFKFDEGKRILNTFDAHQLLHWIGETSKTRIETQTEFKMALLAAYFTEGRDVSDRLVLRDIVNEVGLDGEEAFSLLTDQVYSGDVRALQEQWRQLGISAVPSFIIDEKYIISGGQPKDAFVQSLRQIMAES